MVWPEVIYEISSGIEVKMVGKEALDWDKIYTNVYGNNLLQFLD